MFQRDAGSYTLQSLSESKVNGEREATARSWTTDNDSREHRESLKINSIWRCAVGSWCDGQLSSFPVSSMEGWEGYFAATMEKVSPILHFFPQSKPERARRNFCSLQQAKWFEYNPPSLQETSRRQCPSWVKRRRVLVLHCTFLQLLKFLPPSKLSFVNF